MKKFISILLVGMMCISLCACGENSEKETLSEEETPVTETTPELEPNLQRLQGSWAASENYEEDEPSFECAMPATWDKDMKGYYVVTIKGTQMVYQNFHEKGHNGSRGGEYDGSVFEYVYEIEKVTEKESDEYQTMFLLETTLDGEAKEFEFILYDNPEIYKNSFMLNGFIDFMFVKIGDEQYFELMDIIDDIKYDNAVNEELEPYIGMKKEQLENSTWGKPDDINTTELEGGYIHEQWCYSNGRYVYVENGYVTAIQK